MALRNGKFVKCLYAAFYAILTLIGLVCQTAIKHGRKISLKIRLAFSGETGQILPTLDYVV
jgi:hypothetical protein